MRMGRRLFVGLSPRTNAAAIRALADIVNPYGYLVNPIRVQNCIHLKTACTFLDEETLVINPDWVDPESLKEYRKITVSPHEPLAANTFRINEKVLVADAFPCTAERIEHHGYHVQLINVSECDLDWLWCLI